MPLVAAAIEALDPAHAGATLKAGGTVGVHVDGHDHQLTADDVQVVLQPLEGYQLEREGSHAVALDLEITPELRRAGWVREVVRTIQNARKDAGLDVSDRITLSLDGDAGLLEAVRDQEPYVAGEVLATAVAYAGGAPSSTVTEIDGLRLEVALEKTTP
jgi:isoleucyl-tRNA synthetase